MTPFQLPDHLCPQLNASEVLDKFGPSSSPYIEAVNSLMGRGEYPVHMLVQDRLRALSIHPSALVLTNRRIMVVRRTMMAQSFLDMSWSDANDAHLVESWRGATFAVQSIKGQILEIDALPVDLARPAYAFAQRAEELAAEWRRNRRMEEERARARGVSVSDLLPPTQPLSSSPAPTSGSGDEIEQGLARLMSLKEKGLISEDEYAQKRSELLSRL